VSQAHVVMRKVVQPLFDKKRFPWDPTSISKKKLLLQMHKVLEPIFQGRDSSNITVQDHIMEDVHETFKKLEQAYSKYTSLCMREHRGEVVRMLVGMLPDKPEFNSNHLDEATDDMEGEEQEEQDLFAFND